MNKKLQIIFKIFFIVYCIGIFCVVAAKIYPNLTAMEITFYEIKQKKQAGIMNWNFHLFEQYKYYFQDLFSGRNTLGIDQFTGNIIAFIPLVSKLKTWWKALLSCFIIIMSIEIFQFVSMLGYFDIDDIILNMLGCIIGYLGYIIVKKIYSKIKVK